MEVSNDEMYEYIQSLKEEKWKLEDKLEKIQKIISNEKITGIEAKLMIQDLLEKE